MTLRVSIVYQIFSARYLIAREHVFSIFYILRFESAKDIIVTKPKNTTKNPLQKERIVGSILVPEDYLFAVALAPVTPI